MTKVTVFGAGYVGLVQAAALAEAGYAVVCVDVDQSKVDRLSRGEITIYEPGLQQIVQEAVSSNHLRFTSNIAEAVGHGDIQFIAVGTPASEDGSADVGHVLGVAKSIAQFAEKAFIAVVKSTVPVGTCDKVRDLISQGLAERDRRDIQFDVASNPEFLREGSAVADCMKPDRIIIGTSNRQTELALRELYGPFSRLNADKFVVMDLRSAELAKYAANAMLAARITLMNEISVLADAVGADIEAVRAGVGKDPRIGQAYLYPGVGYGGSCFPKDVNALIRMAEQNDIDPLMLKAVESRNEQQKLSLFSKINKHFAGDLRGRRFALWGLAFKANTDDMREAPSRVIMENLWAAGATVVAFDPKAAESCRQIYGDRPDLELVSDQEQALVGADALVVVTEWKSFRAPDLDELRSRLKTPVVFDGRNLYDPHVMSRHGFTHYSIGRPIGKPEFQA